MKKIVLTGGGTAGHVTPNIALLDKLLDEKYTVIYIGSKNGIEKELISKTSIPYHGISSGKLRRYLDLKNITDFFCVLKGVKEALDILKDFKPNVVFSKGGFVSVPVVMAAKLLKIPVIIHESDMTCGLANKISMPFSTAICASFSDTMKHLPAKKSHLTGSPIRKNLFFGKKEKGISICNFILDKPVVLVMGGSLGSVKINNMLRETLPEILKSFQVVHICGKGNLDTSINNKAYKQFEYVSEDLPDILAMADVVVSRAGANSICEFLALQKPNLLIPLSKNASRGDQILNAKSFHEHGYSEILYEEELTTTLLIEKIQFLYKNRMRYTEKMKESSASNGIDKIMEIIRKAK